MPIMVPRVTKSVLIMTAQITSLVFIAQFVPFYFGFYGCTWQPLTHKSIWLPIYEDALMAAKAGLIVLGIGLFRINRMKKALAQAVQVQSPIAKQ